MLLTVILCFSLAACGSGDGKIPSDKERALKYKHPLLGEPTVQVTVLHGRERPI